MAKRNLITSKRFLKTDDEQAKQAQIDHLQRRLAAVNHDLRQPLQAMGLLCGVLSIRAKDEEIQKMIARLEEILGSAMNILDELLGIEQPESQTAYPEYHEASAPKADRQSESGAGIPVDTEKSSSPTIFIVDDDREVLDAMGDLLKSRNYSVELFESSEQFLAAYRPDRRGCLLVDALLPGMSGLELLKHLKNQNYRLPAAMITGSGDVALAVQAMKAGAADFIEKPVNYKELLAIIASVLQQTHNAPHLFGDRDAALARTATLSARERQVMNMVLEGNPNKNIAADLGISQRTVETHRANIMKKMGAKSLPALLRMTLAAA
jgi:FixJ family two-component response regulator